MRWFPTRFFLVYNKTGVMSRLFHKFEWNKVILCELATPALRKQAILMALILQCFTRHLITFVNINGAEVSSNGRTVNTK